MIKGGVDPEQGRWGKGAMEQGGWGAMKFGKIVWQGVVIQCAQS